jgi:PIN domain nuclease of toxin-antitoxin system
MKLLLDTHAFIWWDSEPDRLPSLVREYCLDRGNMVLLSMASVWEIQIKRQLGKLKLRMPLPEVVNGQQETNGLLILPITLVHVLELDSLPAHQKDPFDRLLIAQARAENAILVSGDSVFSSYDVRLPWQAGPPLEDTDLS